MQKVIVWGITYVADEVFRLFRDSYEILGFFDNDEEKQDKIYQGLPVFSLEELITKKTDYQIIIAVPNAKAQIEKQCKELDIKVMGVFLNGKLVKYNPLHFEDLIQRQHICLYAGDIPDEEVYSDSNIVGLSISKGDSRHIYHNILEPYPLNDDMIDTYTAEDVFEHLPYHDLVNVINEIYRVLKPGGLFRLAVPDYRNDIMIQQSLRNNNGEILYDPNGGGSYCNGHITNGGHLWFPTFEKVFSLFEKSNFEKYNFLHYFDGNGNSITHPIDYRKGYISRTPDHFDRVKNPYRALSIVVDAYK